MTTPVRYTVVPSTSDDDQNDDKGTTFDAAVTSQVDVTETPVRTDQKCGYFHKPAWMLLAVCQASFVQGVVTDGFVNTSVTSIERRFELSSTQSGIIVSLYFFSGVFVNLFVAYFGGRGHKARWVAGGMVLYAIGSALFSLPHFASGYYQYAETDGYSHLCKSDELVTRTYSNSGNATTDHGDLAGTAQNEPGYLYFFVIAQVLFGIGSAPLYTLGIAYLDENVGVHRSSLYLGIFYAVATLGPAVGYIAGGFLLNVYTDVRMASEVTITPEDPAWVGAWWIGMVIASPLALLTAAFLSMFPKELPGAAERRQQNRPEVHEKSGHDVISTRADFGKKPKDFLTALKFLLRNPTLMSLNAVSVCSAMVTMGYAAYLPKLVETHFGQTASFSATIVGASVVAGGSGGSVIGGWLVKRYQWNIRSMLLFCISSTVVSALLLNAFLLRCEGSQMAGILDPVKGKLTETGCLDDCSCTTLLHTPVCARDQQIEYFSPCHAGCKYEFENNTYGGCSCISGDDVVLKGNCQPETCPQLIVFIIGLFLIVFVGFLPAISALQVTLRCVPESQRSFCLGLANVMAKVFGSFPSPIIFGAIFDSTCVVWQTDENGNEHGSCWLYDVSKLSRRIFMFSECMLIMAIGFYVMALYLYKPIKADDTADDNDENKEKLANGQLQTV